MSPKAVSLTGRHYSWTCALELERQRGGMGAFLFASSRVEELQDAGDEGGLEMWVEIRDRVRDLHALDTRVVH